MTPDLLTAEEREQFETLREVVGDSIDDDINPLIAIIDRLAPAPVRPLEQILYEAEGLYDKPWRTMRGRERAQYERMAAAARARGAL